MTKRRPALTDDHLEQVWDIRSVDHSYGELESLGDLISSAVSRILRESGETRSDIAVGITELLAEPVSRQMLDAYASESRQKFAISAHRLFALVALTGRWDVLDALVRQIGGKVIHRTHVDVYKAGLAYVDMQVARTRWDEARAALGLKATD